MRRSEIDECALVLAIVRDWLTTYGFMTSTLAVTDAGNTVTELRAAFPNDLLWRAEVRIDDFGISLVSGLADALNAHDLVRARSYLADDLHYVGVFGPPIDGADAYLDAMARLGAQQIIVKCLVGRDEVACQYNLTLPGRPDTPIFCCGWFTISDGRIKSLRVVFDPTPLRKT